MKRLVIGLVALAVLLGGARQATADVIYSTFGAPGDMFDEGKSYTIEGLGHNPSFPIYSAVAMTFQPAADATLDRIRFAIGNFFEAAFIDAVVAADSGGSPGVALETFSAVSVPRNTVMIVNVDSVTHPSLAFATSYWLVLQPHDPASDISGDWFLSFPAVLGQGALRFETNGSWSPFSDTQAAFAILGTPTVVTGAPGPVVPEPSGLVLFVLGALSLVGYCRRRQKLAV
jgi:hypothetical protein